MDIIVTRECLTKTLAVRITPSMAEAIRQAARERHLKPSELARHALRLVVRRPESVLTF